jgi:hypothetical protein
MDTNVLFSGHRTHRGGLSNEQELAKLCPSQFLDTQDPWHHYVAESDRVGWDRTKWKWKTTDPAVQTQQEECLDALLDGSYERLSITMRRVIAAWMLSEMLEDVPPIKEQQG